MGPQSSKQEHYESNAFSTTENKYLEQLFVRIAGDESRTFNEKQLKDYLSSTHLTDFSTQLYSYMMSVHSAKESKHPSRTSPSKADHVSFVSTMMHALKGDSDQLAHLLTFLSGIQDDQVHLSELLKLISQLVRISISSPLSKTVWKDPSEQSFNAFVRYLCHDLVNKGQKSQCDVIVDTLPITHKYSIADVELWLSRTAFLQDIIRCAFSHCFPTDEVLRLRSLVPVCEPSRQPKSLVLEKSAHLDSAAITFLNHCLPHDLRGVLRPLFSSVKQGESFSALIRTVVNQGPSLIVVEDSDGHIFGGFAAESWTLRPQFYGSAYCFLFTLLPVMDVYLPSGLNTNYMYLNQNQTTLPNGLGMGGQFEYFGFWLDQQYGTGHSKAQPKCTTYKSPQLSARPQFSIRTIEVWAVGPGATSDTQGADLGEKDKKGSVLDKVDAGTKALLEMVGKSNLSDALRDADNLS